MRVARRLPDRLTTPAALAGAALLLRLAVAAAALRDPSIPRQGDDYLALGAAFLEGGRNPDPRFPPLVPALSALCVAVAGPHAQQLFLLLQALASAGTVWLLARAGRPASGAATSRLPPALAAVDPLLLVGAAFVLTEEFFSLFLVGAIVALRRWDDTPGRDDAPPAFAAGMLLGAAAVTRSVGLLALLPAVAFVLTAPRPRPRRLLAAVRIAVAALLVLLPAAVHHRRGWGRFAPSCSGPYNLAALLVAPAAAAEEGVPVETIRARWRAEAAADPADGPFEQADRLGARALAWALAHPAATLRANAAALARLPFSPGRAAWAELLGRPQESVPRPWLALLVGWRAAIALLFAAALVSLVRGGPGGGRLALLLGGLVLLPALATGASAYARFLRPLVPVMLATIGAAGWSFRLRERA